MTDKNAGSVARFVAAIGWLTAIIGLVTGATVALGWTFRPLGSWVFLAMVGLGLLLVAVAQVARASTENASNTRQILEHLKSTTKSA